MYMSLCPDKPIWAGFFETRPKVSAYQVSVGSHLCSAKVWDMASGVAALAPPASLSAAAGLPWGQDVQRAPYRAAIVLPNGIGHHEGQRDPGLAQRGDMGATALCGSDRQQRIKHAV